MESTEIPSPHDPTPQSQEDLCHHGEENDTRQSLQIEETPPADETDAAYQRPDATNTRISFQEEEEKFIPLEETPSGYPELDWKPLVLQNWCLFLATAFFGACMTGLVIIVCLNNIAPEMLHVAQTSSRLAFRYVPAAAGTVTTVWWGSVARSYLRLIPYITMASASTGLSGRAPQGLLTLRSVSNLLAFFPTPAALARLIKERHILTMITFSTSFLVIPFLTPLKNALFQTTQDPAGWSITVSNKVAYIAITVYSLLMGTTISILVRLWSVRTGLKWEASSIASQLALVQGSNIYEPFYGLEFEDPSHLYRIAGSWHVEYGVLRLGYWMVLRNGEETIWHGVRFYKPEVVEQPPTPRDEAETPTLEQRGTHEEGGSASPFLGDYNVTFSRNIDEAPLHADGYYVDHPERFRYRTVYLNHIDSVLALILAIGLAFVVICIFGMSRGIIQDGFTFTPPAPMAGIALVREILFAFLPSVLFSLFSMEMYASSYFYRCLQPIASMETPVPAEESVLLDYIGPNAASVTLTATLNKHWRVAWFTLLATLSSLPPILIAGTFTAKEAPGGWHMTVAPASFYTLFAVLVVYCISLVFSRPPPEYRTLIIIPTLAELLTLCYDSHIMNSNEFYAQDPSDREIHLVSKVHLAKRKYHFGLYLGRDGRRHLGFDATSEKAIENGVSPVYGIRPGRAIYLSGKPIWFRYPNVSYSDGE